HCTMGPAPRGSRGAQDAEDGAEVRLRDLDHRSFALEATFEWLKEPVQLARRHIFCRLMWKPKLTSQIAVARTCCAGSKPSNTCAAVSRAVTATTRSISFSACSASAIALAMKAGKSAAVPR